MATQLRVVNSAVVDLERSHDEALKKLDCLKLAEEAEKQKILKVEREAKRLPEKYVSLMKINCNQSIIRGFDYLEWKWCSSHEGTSHPEPRRIKAEPSCCQEAFGGDK